MRLRTNTASSLLLECHAQRLYRNKMPERQILGIRSGGFNGRDSCFGEDGEKRLINTKGATIMTHPHDVLYVMKNRYGPMPPILCGEQYQRFLPNS